jgi:hypothetical protein
MIVKKLNKIIKYIFTLFDWIINNLIIKKQPKFIKKFDNHNILLLL